MTDGGGVEMRELPERIYLYQDMMGAVTWTLKGESNSRANAIEYMRITEAELRRLRNQAAEVHTMTACRQCGDGVRPRNAVRGLCPRCAEELLDVTDKLLTERNRVLDAIPKCPAHGSQCVPHAIEWIEGVQAGEKMQLRRDVTRLQDEIDALLARDIPELQEALNDAEAELARLRRIEMTIRECPTTKTEHGFKSLVYTTQLRDALEAK